ncbi:MAG: hypothetical protein EZS28_008300, partial [Streblomastix strix]
YYTGGIYGEFRQGGIFNFSFNEFTNNSKYDSENGANDAYLIWNEYPQSWNIDNAKYKVLKIFENCTHSNEKNVYYEFRVNNEFDISGYITSGNEEQDPGDDLEEGTDGCIFNVDQTQTIEGTKRTIKGALAGNCTDSNGYLITLLNSIHYESVTINKTEEYPVLTKGGAKDEEQNEIRTVWGVNTSAARIITLLQGNLTLSNIEFKYYQSTTDPEDDQDETIWPWNAIIFAYDEVLSFRILSVDSCIFKGLGPQIPVRRMIYGHNVQKMNLTDYWNINNYKNKIIETFEKCSSTSGKSIYVEFRVNNEFDVSRYIYVQDLKLDDIYISPEKKQNIPENEGAETVKDAIQEIINEIQESYIIVPTNEVYEESSIVVAGDKQFILQPTSTSEEESKPVLQASTNQDSLMTVSGNGKVQIDGFVITHINEDVEDKPLIEMSGNSLLQLIGITVSPNKRTKDDKGIHIEQSKSPKSSPFLSASGKQVLIDNMIMEPTSFYGCSGIILKGENEEINHSFILNISTFHVSNYEQGLQSILNSNGFTVRVFDTIFIGLLEQEGIQAQNVVNDEESCQWSTSTVHLKEGDVYFGNTTFSGLGDGALFVGAGAKVTISETTLLYGNKPSGTSGRMKNIQRNIVCDGEEDNKAELQAESESFIEKGIDGQYKESINKWVMINKDTCLLTGILSDIRTNLLYSPYISSIIAEQMDQINDLSVKVAGTSLIGCKKMLLQLKQKSTDRNEEIDTQHFLFEDYAKDWINDTEVTLDIKLDKIQLKGQVDISVVVEIEKEKYEVADIIEGGSSSTSVEIKELIPPEDPDDDPTPEDPIDVGPKDEPLEPETSSKGISSGALIGIIVAVVVVVVVVVTIPVIVCYIVMSKRSSANSKIRAGLNTKSRPKRRKQIAMDSNNW